MTRTDRRSVLTGFGALALGGCSGANKAPPSEMALDFADLERRHGGRIGVVAAGMPTIASWRADERFLYCSTFKLFLAAATLERAAQSYDSLARLVPVRQEDMVAHAPVTGPLVGQALTIEALCQAVVEQSDNPAANILIRELGGVPALRAWYESIGDRVTRVDRTEPELNRPDGDRDTTTPMQFARNMDLVLHRPSPVRAQVVPALTRWLLASPTGPGRIKAAAPDGWRVAHKTGTSALGHTNDIGVLYGPAGELVTMAIFYEGQSSASAETRDAVVAETGRRTLKALGFD